MIRKRSIEQAPAAHTRTARFIARPYSGVKKQEEREKRLFARSAPATRTFFSKKSKERSMK